MKKLYNNGSILGFLCALVFAATLFALPLGASAFEVTDNLTVTGYLAMRLSMNTSNITGNAYNAFSGNKSDGRGELSMTRGTLYLQADGSYAIADFPFNLTAIAEISKEWFGDYLKDLDSTSSADVRDNYQRDKIDESTLREYYVDFNLGERWNFRLGKQQVAWGRTDYWQVMDIVCAYDWTWRHFLEVENEWTRKPTIMANAIVQIPEINAKLQLLFRPGWDESKDVISNGYDIDGGRWSGQPNKGVSFPYDFGVPTNYKHNKGDYRDPNGGFRWESYLGPVEYSLAYYHGNSRNPVVNVAWNPYGDIPTSPSGAELINPEIDTVGATGTYYWDWADVVTRTEIAYTIDQPFNFGSYFAGGAFPGFGGIIEKDLVKWMVAFDKQVGFVKWLFGAYRPGFWNLQLYDEWIMNYKDSDDIVWLAGYGSTLKEHSFKVSGWLNWNYDYDRITTGVSYAWDPTYGGVLLIPNINFAYGNHWRVRLEWSKWIVDDWKNFGEIEDDANLFGLFKNNDQLYLRIMYYF